VLSLPLRLRFLAARDERVLGKLRAIFVRSVGAWQKGKARAQGIRGARTGAVVFTQRFSSRLMLWPHFHALVPDGLFAEGEDGKVVFHELKPREEDVEAIAERIARKAGKWLTRLEGVQVEVEALDQVRSAARQGELSLKLPQVEPLTEVSGRLLANVEGFSLQAARHLHANDRKGLEFLIRYVLRPPLSQRRVERLKNGNILEWGSRGRWPTGRWGWS
jgi:hypothetical protein